MVSEARAWYQRGLDVWIDLRKKGTLIPMYAFRLGDGAHNVTKCDRALGASASPHASAAITYFVPGPRDDLLAQSFERNRGC
jgi:hypothetical protein